MKHEEHTPSNSLHLEQQLAEVLAPLGVQAEEHPEQSPPSIEIVGEEGIRITTYYLCVFCEHASRLSITARITPLLSYQSDAICVTQGDTRKSKRGYLIFGAPTPFRRVVTTWVDAQDDITDWLCFSAVADIDVEA